MGFVHLHNHTQYSLLDGACRVDRMVALAKQYNMPAVAMTDHGNMFGTIDFVTACQKAGIKPIVGTEAYVIPGELDDADNKKQRRHHLVLLAKNLIGYQNLCKLSSFSYQKGFYYKPRMTKSLLRQYREGLICTTACIQGEIPSLLLQGRDEEARKVMLELKDIFGKDIYIELQDHGIKEEREVMPKLIALAEATGIEMIVTNDCHYLKKEDAEAHDILLCIQTNHYESEIDRMKYPTEQLYFKTEEEMRELFPHLPQAYDNTLRIAEEINLELDYNKFLFPNFDVPKDFADSEEYLKALCYDAVHRRYNEITPEIQKRLDYELQVINKMGFNDYFLIVRDFINASRERGIPVGPGRGSAAGSIVAYLLEITQLDPLKYELLFERFLNLTRAEMPDIDIDFDSEGRERVIDYVVGKYGSESVCQIITFGTMGAKTVIRDVGRVLEVPLSEVNKIAKLIPETAKMTLEKAYNISHEMRQLIDSNPIYQRVYRIGNVLEGLIRQTGVHAAGVVMGPGDLSNYVPLAVTPQKGNNAQTTLVQYEGKWLEHLKMLKMDFLGLKTLTLIRKTQDLIRRNYNIDLDIDNIHLDDEKVYELLSNAETDGVFQLESSGMKKYLKKLKPNVFDDIIAMVALYRPGPMQYIDHYIARKHGTEPITYRHPVMEKALKSTYGITVYQEQVMQISKDLAGFDSASAGVLRKAMSKKKEKMMTEMYTMFEEGCQSNSVNITTIQQIWEDFKEFAQYAFNKSHAACYAYIAYQTAYLKAYYPVEFMAALMSEEKDPAKIPLQIEVCRQMNIEVIPPDINLSQEEFSVDDNKILYGLKGIKNVGSSAVRKILEERNKEEKFDTIWNFCSRLDSSSVNKAVIESLIMAGAMDGLEGSRSQKYMVVQKAIDYAASIFEEKKRGQMTIFDDFIEESALTDPQLPEIPEWDFGTKLQKEKDVLGFFWSGHPLDKYSNLISAITNVESDIVQKEGDNIPQNVIISGIANAIMKKRTRKGNPFAIITMEDKKGKFEVCLFGDKYDLLTPRFEAGKEYLIEGRNNYQGEGIFSVLPDRIYRLNEIPGKRSGELKVELAQEELSDELCDFLIEHSGTENQVKLNLILKTKHFKTLHCQTNLSLQINESLLGRLKETSGKNPKLIFN
ncbi:MAG: DNA polymerase III subunit alpha [Candidatus Cloacimonetes bacterium]|nr:DNA polymerase III subunit alpha [Candidatus Cloacimonadota bacterium]